MGWDFLAAWGAALSTVLAVKELTKGYPVFQVHHENGDKDRSYRVTAINRSDCALMIHRIKPFFAKVKFSPQAETTGGAVRMAMSHVEYGEFNFAIPPQDKAHLYLEFEQKPTFVIAVVFWTSTQASFLGKLPVLFVLTKKKLRALRWGGSEASTGRQ